MFCPPYISNTYYTNLRVFKIETALEQKQENFVVYINNNHLFRFLAYVSIKENTVLRFSISTSLFKRNEFDFTYNDAVVCVQSAALFISKLMLAAYRCCGLDTHLHYELKRKLKQIYGHYYSGLLNL